MSKEPEGIPVMANAVEVELVANKFTNVLVAVLVAKIELKNPWDAESWVVEAIGNVLIPVAVEVIAPAIARVEVAVIAPPKKEVPEKYPLPCTASVLVGVEVPMPKFPPAVKTE